MTVKELIEKLQKFDGDRQVFRNDGEYGPEEIYDVFALEEGGFGTGPTMPGKAGDPVIS